MCQDHPHDHPATGDLPPAIDLSIPDSELSPEQLNRRSLLRGVGMLGAGVTAGGVLSVAGPAAARADDDRGGYQGGLHWLAGDHHIHTQYSADALYRVIDQARHARAYGLDWMVITDHGGATHARIGVELVNPDIVAARAQLRDLLVFQGLEWNIPAAEHGTVFVHPGRNEVAVLKEFENGFDGSVTGSGSSSPANEARAVAGIQFLGSAVRDRRVDGALFLANHPARRGIDSPHELRAWRDADPSVAIGMEGAPGHQAAGIAAPGGPGSGRGFYTGGPGPESFPGYPAESYRTWGGFDWFTATVGGLWDSLLAEGKPWWISANSDSHVNYLDVATRGPNSDFDANGRYNDPVYGGVALAQAGDFWPGFYSRTHVGTGGRSYRAVMDGLRAGRVWVDHGALIAGLDVRVRVRGDRRGGVPLGGTLRVRRGTPVELAIDVDLAVLPNWAQFVPRLARVDVITGTVTGPAADRDTLFAPDTRVARSFEVPPGARHATFTHPLGPVDRPGYVRVRGTDGNRTAPGFRGADVDPAGPAMDTLGNADPWTDLWLYTNPIFIEPVSRS
ncbi:MAG TPA: PHP domain-containing protein [Actinophytocola sp.]|uniref:PHP domain-containing protein n=1 Tax=Actinophytocola sp. TaxID=1872138 RepID=UPI002DBDB202|nr:PHP domain-containing protein [Actinophytocola sp.]HEU5474066.1 PHP domain-containing protein [Actinophytocola sp.]